MLAASPGVHIVKPGNHARAPGRRAGDGESVTAATARATPRSWAAIAARWLRASQAGLFVIAVLVGVGSGMGAVAILIFWLCLAGIAILLGAEINTEAERQAAAEAGHPQTRASANRLNQTHNACDPQRLHAGP